MRQTSKPSAAPRDRLDDPSTIAPSPEITYFPQLVGHFASGMIRTANFGFLAAHDSNLVTLGGQAERYFRDDPPTCLWRSFSRRLGGGSRAGRRQGPLVWIREYHVGIMNRFGFGLVGTLGS